MDWLPPTSIAIWGTERPSLNRGAAGIGHRVHPDFVRLDLGETSTELAPDEWGPYASLPPARRLAVSPLQARPDRPGPSLAGELAPPPGETQLPQWLAAAFRLSPAGRHLLAA